MRVLFKYSFLVFKFPEVSSGKFNGRIKMFNGDFIRSQAELVHHSLKSKFIGGVLRLEFEDVT